MSTPARYGPPDDLFKDEHVPESDGDHVTIVQRGSGQEHTVRVVILQPKRLGMWMFLSVVAWQLIGLVTP